MRKITKQLLKKSTESFLLALELFNKPTIEFRTEAFAILFTNAWELLMKSHIYEKSCGKKLSIFKRKRPKQKRETITIDECLIKIFLNENDPVRKNIEYISELRNAAIHLIITELDPYFSRVFQAGVFNYLNSIYDWFGINLEEKLKPGLLSLVIDLKGPNINLLKKRHNKENFNTLLGLIQRFRELEKLGLEGTLSMKYTVAIVKNAKNADFVISAGKKGIRKAIIVEKPKDIDLTHPFNMTTAVIEIKKRVPKKTRSKFTNYDILSYCFIKGIRKTQKNEYFWKPKYSGAGQYSQKFIDEISESIQADSKNISKWRKQYSLHLKRKKAKL